MADMAEMADMAIFFHLSPSLLVFKTYSGTWE
jgi:hypothetical protein